MNRKQLKQLIVLVLVVGGLGIAFYKRRSDSWQSSGSAVGQKVLPDFPLNDIAHVVIRQGSEQLHLDKKEEVWRVREKFEYPASFSQISELLRKFWEMKVTQRLKIGASQLGRLQLLPPDDKAVSGGGVLVEFKDGQDRIVRSVVLGKTYLKQVPDFSPFASRGGFPVGRYLMVQGASKDEAYLVSDALSDVSMDPGHWVDREFVKIEKPKEIEVTPLKPESSFKMVRESENGEFKLEGVKGNEKFDPSTASNLAQSLSSLRFSEVAASSGAQPAELDKGITAQVTTFDGFQYGFRLAKKGAEDKYYLQVSVTGEFPKERVPGKEEKSEDKMRLDQEFKDRIENLKKKLAQEKQFKGWVYLADKYAVDSLLKERKDLMKKKEEEIPKAESKPASPSSPAASSSDKTKGKKKS